MYLNNSWVWFSFDMYFNFSVFVSPQTCTRQKDSILSKVFVMSSFAFIRCCRANSLRNNNHTWGNVKREWKIRRREVRQRMNVLNTDAYHFPLQYWPTCSCYRTKRLLVKRFKLIQLRNRNAHKPVSLDVVDSQWTCWADIRSLSAPVRLPRDALQQGKVKQEVYDCAVYDWSLVVRWKRVHVTDTESDTLSAFLFIPVLKPSVTAPPAVVWKTHRTIWRETVG